MKFLLSLIKKPFIKKAYLVWHHDSPGVKVIVYRNWFQDFYQVKHFAGLGETIIYGTRDHAIDRTKSLFRDSSAGSSN